jgi:hypothetical protein
MPADAVEHDRAPVGGRFRGHGGEVDLDRADELGATEPSNLPPLCPAWRQRHLLATTLETIKLADTARPEVIRIVGVLIDRAGGRERADRQAPLASSMRSRATAVRR